MKKPIIPTFKKPRPLAGVPKLADVMPNLSSLIAKQTELSKEDSELAAEDLHLAQEIAAAFPDTPLTRAEAGSEQQQRVAAILGTDHIASRSPAIDRRKEIAGRRSDLRLALEHIERAIQAERQLGAAKVNEAVRPVYGQHLLAVVRALQEVHAANLALHAVTDALQDDGVAWTGLGVHFPSFIGWPTDPNGPLAIYLRELVSGGYLDRSDIPAELR